jgi:uncharacterized phage protein gp47/JayE
MATDSLPGELLLFTREQHRQNYLRDYRLVDPNAETGPGTQPDNDASTLADQLVVVGHNAQVIANGTTDEFSSGEWLERRGAAIRVEWGEATGASGYAVIGASTGGGYIDEGVVFRHKTSRLRFQCAVADTYVDGDLVPVIGIDTGAETNLGPGEVLELPNPPEGIYPTATVFEAGDGTGLTGGHARQTPEEYREELRRRRAEPPASGNDAEYQEAVRKTPGLAVQQVFTYPAIRGPGTTGIAFTLRPARPGGSRIPNDAQLAIVEARLKALFPADDGIFVCALLDDPVSVALEVKWAPTAAGFVDTSPWPPPLSDPVRVSSSATPTATTFRLYTTAVSPPAPAVGQTIAFYNAASGRFVRKRIRTVSASVVGSETRWAITCDTTNNVSDTSFVPVAEQMASPWSGSSNLVAASVVSQFDRLGPGEQVSTFYDSGRRQKRQPETSAEWPNEITNRLISPIFSISAVSDVELTSPEIPHVTTVGTPGVESYLMSLSDLAILKQTT